MSSPFYDWLVKVDRDIAEDFGARRRCGRRPTISDVMAEKTARATGWSKKTSKTVVHGAAAVGTLTLLGLLVRAWFKKDEKGETDEA
jgi:hypothetical protein